MTRAELRIRFDPLDQGTLRRTVRLPDRDEPVTDEVEIPSDLYPERGPGGSSPDADDLHELEPAALRSIGRRIAELALGTEGRTALDDLRRTGKPVRIVFEESMDAAAAAAVPWELMHDGEEYLSAHPRVHVVRTVADGPHIDSLTTRRPLRVLILWASPRDQAPVDIEWEQIRLGLALAPHMNRREIEVVEVLHTTRARLDEFLAAGAYDLVYYTGHGDHRDGTGQLCLETDDGTTDLLSATRFARKLARLESPPALVFLNCCLSGAVDRESPEPTRAPDRVQDPPTPGRFLDVGRRLLREGVPFVVATLTPVFVSTAQEFVDELLRALLAGDRFDVERAVAAARDAVLEDRDFERRQRQTFFQYLLLTATGADWSHTRQEEGAAEAVRERILYRSAEYPGDDPARVRRNRLLVRVEAAWAQGDRAVGVHGIGGIGKTVFSAQALERAVGHAVPGLRAERAVWLDLRQSEDLHGSLIEQICFVLDQAGAAGAAQALRAALEPEPMAVARALAGALGPDCVLALDNCETLLDDAGGLPDGPARALVTALVGHTGWRTLLTSRERFSLAREGRDPTPIHWLPVEELTPAERGALLRSALDRSDLDWKKSFEAETRRRIFDEVAGHPYELGLFLGDPRAATDPEGLIDDVHRETGEYARLEYYLGRVPAEALPVLQLVAALDEPAHGSLIDDLWNGLAGAFDWPQAEDQPDASLIELTRRTLVEERDGSYTVLPVLVRHLQAGDSAHGLPPDRQDRLHRGLAQGFRALSEAAAEQAKTLHREGDLPERELHGALVGLATARLDLLHRAFRHALRQEEPDLTQLLLERLVDTTAGRLPTSRLLAYAQEVAAIFEKLVAGAPSDAPPPVAALGFGVVGKALATLRAWQPALAAYERSLDLCQRTGQEKLIGTAHHQIGIVHQQQRHWKPALESYQQAIEWKHKTGQHQHLGSTHHQIGRVHQEQRHWEFALESYRQAIEWFEKTGQTQHIGTTHHQIGRVHEEQRHWEPALESYGHAIEWKQKTGQLHQLGITHHQIGMVHQEQRHWQPALESYRHAIEWFQKTGQHHQLGMTHHQIGRVHQEQRHWEPALESYGQAIEWFQKTGQLHELGGTHHQIGRVHQEQRHWEPALESYRQAIEWKQKTGQHHQLGMTHHQIGIVHQEQRHWGPALESYRQVIEWKQKTGQVHQLGMTHHQIGIVHQEQRHWKRALESYRHAIEWFEKTGQLHEIGGTLHQIGQVHEERGLLEDAGHGYLEALASYGRHGFGHPNEVLITLGTLNRLLARDDLPDESRAALREELDGLLGEHPVLAQAQEALAEGEREDGQEEGSEEG